MCLCVYGCPSGRVCRIVRLIILACVPSVLCSWVCWVSSFVLRRRGGAAGTEQRRSGVFAVSFPPFCWCGPAPSCRRRCAVAAVLLAHSSPGNTRCRAARKQSGFRQGRPTKPGYCCTHGSELLPNNEPVGQPLFAFSYARDGDDDDDDDDDNDRLQVFVRVCFAAYVISHVVMYSCEKRVSVKSGRQTSLARLVCDHACMRPTIALPPFRGWRRSFVCSHESLPSLTLLSHSCSARAQATKKDVRLNYTLIAPLPRTILHQKRRQCSGASNQKRRQNQKHFIAPLRESHIQAYTR